MADNNLISPLGKQEIKDDEILPIAASYGKRPLVETQQEKLLPGVKFTASAAGANVKFIGLSVNAGKGNIHSGAVPPWELDDDEDLVTVKEKEKIKDDEELDNYLPNFGGVWNAGSRRSTREEFIKVITEKKQFERAKKRVKLDLKDTN